MFLLEVLLFALKSSYLRNRFDFLEVAPFSINQFFYSSNFIRVMNLEK